MNLGLLMKNVFFLITHKRWAKYPYSVKDFDTGLLEKYTVKVLHIMHAGSLGSARSSSL